MAKPKKQEAEKEVRNSVTLEVLHGTPSGPTAGDRRTFTREAHGEAFEEEAKQWAERFGAKEV